MSRELYGRRDLSRCRKMLLHGVWASVYLGLSACLTTTNLRVTNHFEILLKTAGFKMLVDYSNSWATRINLYNKINWINLKLGSHKDAMGKSSGPEILNLYNRYYCKNYWLLYNRDFIYLCSLQTDFTAYIWLILKSRIKIFKVYVIFKKSN